MGNRRTSNGAVSGNGEGKKISKVSTKRKAEVDVFNLSEVRSFEYVRRIGLLHARRVLRVAIRRERNEESSWWGK